jgi:hypothetical protein
MVDAIATLKEMAEVTNVDTFNNRKTNTHRAEAAAAQLPQRAVRAAADLDVLEAQRHALHGRRRQRQVQGHALVDVRWRGEP